MLIIVTRYYPIVFQRVLSDTTTGNDLIVTPAVTPNLGVTKNIGKIVTPKSEDFNETERRKPQEAET